jgi:hypothetical protein
LLSKLNIATMLKYTMGESSACANAWHNAYDPNNKTYDKPTILFATGKSLNDLGDYDICDLTPGLVYATITINIKSKYKY